MPYRSSDKTLLGEEFDSLAVYPFAPRLHPHPIPVEDICDEPLVCISMNATWAGHVLGLLEVLNQEDAWVGNADDIYAARQKVLRLMTMFSFPCSDQTTQLLADNSYIQYIEQVFGNYDGTAHSLDRDAPDTSFISDPDDVGNDEIDRIEALCWTCRLFVQALCQAEIQRRNGISSVAQIVGNLLNIPLLFFLTSGTIPYLAIQIAQFIIVAGANAFAGISAAVLGNAASQEAVACCMYNYLASQSSNSRSIFMLSLENCDFGVSPEEALRGAIAPMLNDNGNYFAFLKTLGETLRYKRADLLDACPCDEWAHTFLSIPNERLPNETLNLGTFDPINVWYIGEYEAEFVRRSVDVRTTSVTPFIVTHVTCEFRTVVTNPFTPRNATIYGFDGVAADPVIVQIQTTTSGTYTLDSGPINLTTLGLVFEIFSRSGGEPADTLEVRSITIEGRGYDPFA